MGFQSGESEADEVADLKTAASAVAQNQLLDKDSDFVFNFLTSPGGSGAGGHLVAAVSGTFPPVVGQDLSMAVAFMGPCGYVTPHSHPRATEFAYAVNGTMQVGFLEENGDRFVFNEVAPGQAAIFPKGSIHFEMNNGCDPMIFVAALNNEDPGVTSTAQTFLGLPPDIVAAVLGGIPVDQVAKIESLVPDSLALGTDECLNRCGLKRTAQPTTQRQPRVSANALPSGYQGPPAPSAAAGGTSKLATSGSLGVTDSNGKVNPLLIALIIICSLMAVGYIILIATWFIRKNGKGGKKRGQYIRTGGEFAPEGAAYSSSAYDTAAPYEKFRASEDRSLRTTPYDRPAGDS